MNDDEYDEYREANPSRRAQLLSEILNWDPEKSMLSQPEPKTETCVACHQEFQSEPQEFNGHWVFPNLCSIDCGDAKEAVRAKAEPAKIRSFECPKCGIRKNVQPVLSGNEWHYFGLCSNCGQTWANIRFLVIKCPLCNKKVAITSRNPTAKCWCDGSKPDQPF